MKTAIRAILFAVMVAFCLTAAQAQQSALERIEARMREQVRQAVDGMARPAAPPNNQPAGDAATVAPPRRVYLGIVADDHSERGRGIRVLDVLPGGPGDKAGIMKGDLILEMGGIRIRQMSEMAEVLDRYSPGDTVSVEVLRQERPKAMRLVLTGRPNPIVEPPAADPPRAVRVPPRPEPPADVALPPPPGMALPAPGLPATVAAPAADDPGRIAKLEARIEQLERRIAELEKVQSEKPVTAPQLVAPQ